jgi:hypothetical protein
MQVGPCDSFPELIFVTFCIEDARYALPAVFSPAPLSRRDILSRVLVIIDRVWIGEQIY